MWVGFLWVVGINVCYSIVIVVGILVQWQCLVLVYFVLLVVSFGICYNGDVDGYFDYLVGILCQFGYLMLQGWYMLDIVLCDYLVVWYVGYILIICVMWCWLLDVYLLVFGLQLVDVFDLECYDVCFNDYIGYGGVEIWLFLDMLKECFLCV